MKKINKFFAFIITIIMIVSVMIISSNAALNEGINLANVKKNMSGDGYKWDNINKVLTFDNLEIYTDMDFGFKIPSGARIVIVGENIIHAGKYGLGLVGNATFEGDGKLEIESSEAGIYSYSDNSNHKILFRSGEYEIKSGTPVLSEAAELSFTGAEFDLESKNGNSIECNSLVMNAGKIEAEGSVIAKYKIDISFADLEIDSINDSPALICNDELKLSDMSIKVGDNDENLNDVEEYNGETVIETKADSHSLRRSFLFGEKCSVLIDILLLILVIAIVVALIAIPFIRKKKKVAKMYKELEESKEGK